MGIVYLIQPEELLGTNRYKIGCSSFNDTRRIQDGYHKYTEIHCVIHVRDYLAYERLLKMVFRKKYSLVCGNEFFEGDINKIKYDFMNLYLYHMNPLETDPIEEVGAEVIGDYKLPLQSEMYPFVPSLKKFELNEYSNCFEKRCIYGEKVYRIKIPADDWSFSINRKVRRWLRIHQNFTVLPFPFGEIVEEDNRVNPTVVVENRCEYCARKCSHLQTKRRHMDKCTYRERMDG